MSQGIQETAQYRVGEWLPSDRAILEDWLDTHIEEAEKENLPLLPIIQEFRELIESDAKIYMFFTQMFSQVPHWGRYKNSPSGKPQVRDYKQMLQLVNFIMTKAPTYNKTGLVGFPINAILNWSMATEGGYAGFLNGKVNAMLKKVLNEWGLFLKSKDSAYVLNDDPRTGWLGDDAMLGMFPNKNNDPQRSKDDFVKTFHCHPDEKHWGFTSWDDFFTRTFREGQRPVAAPGDDSVIVNACESAPYKIARDVQLREKFWIKAQPYSLQHMLNNDKLVERFVGGTIYQAFLSAKSYHRWNSPISGTIVNAYVQDGTYYSETPAEGFYNPLHANFFDRSPDEAAPNDSQGYISEVATRAMVFIEADNRDIGLMGFMPIGMAEVSSCDITVYEGQRVEKGDQIGMFHFGGSTHCLLFGPHVKLEFDLHGQTPGLNSHNINVRAKLATVMK